MTFGLLLGLPSCGTTTPTSSSINQQIYVADQAVTSVVGSADAALNAHLISKAQAQSVSTIAHQVAPLLDAARAAVASSDMVQASKDMTLVNSLLAALQTYVPKTSEPVPPAHPDGR